MVVVRAILLLLLLLVATLAAGCALNEDEADHEAGAAVKSVVEREYAGAYADVWNDLHPRHQRFVTEDEYEDCRRGIDVAGILESVLVLDVHDEPITVFGLRPRTPSKAVRVRITTDETEFTAVYHAVRVGNRWRWVLSDRAARGFARTDCPT
jgi:hypothetical protein